MAVGGARSTGYLATRTSAAVSALRGGRSRAATTTGGVATGGGGASAFDPEVVTYVITPARTAIRMPTMTTTRARRRGPPSTGPPLFPVVPLPPNGLWRP